jgi:hypothetical protein
MSGRPFAAPFSSSSAKSADLASFVPRHGISFIESGWWMEIKWNRASG